MTSGLGGKLTENQAGWRGFASLCPLLSEFPRGSTVATGHCCVRALPSGRVPRAFLCHSKPARPPKRSSLLALSPAAVTSALSGVRVLPLSSPISGQGLQIAPLVPCLRPRFTFSPSTRVLISQMPLRGGPGPRKPGRCSPPS